MRQRVMAAADALGYQPNVIARSLITRRTNIVAIVMENLTDPFYPVVLEELCSALQAKGYHVLIFIAPKSQNFALYADIAAHGKVGQPALERLSKEMGEHFKRSGYTEGIVHVLQSLASTLAEHFPIQPDDRDESLYSSEQIAPPARIMSVWRSLR